MPIGDTSSAHEGLLQRMSSMGTGDRIGQLHRLDPSGGIIDGNGNELLTFDATGNAANHLQVTNQTAAKNPSLDAVGDDTNIDIYLRPKGTGKAYADRIYVKDADDTTSPSRYLGVGAAQDGMFYALAAGDVYLDARTSAADLRIRANDGGVLKTFIEIDASEALLKLGNAASDVTLGELAQGSTYALRPETTEKFNLGSSSFRFNDVHFVTLAPKTVQTYTPTNVTPDRSYDADATSDAEIADVLGTLITDLQTLGILA